MQIDRRQLAFPVLALGLLSAVPAFAGADEDAIAKNLEGFRAAQATGNTEVIASICAEELSYSHSNAKSDTKASLLNGIATANYKWTSLEYRDPTIRIVGPAAIVRFNFVGEQEFADGKKTPQNLHILMNWQKQGNDWKLLSRAATSSEHDAALGGLAGPRPRAERRDVRFRVLSGPGCGRGRMPAGDP